MESGKGKEVRTRLAADFQSNAGNLVMLSNPGNIHKGSIDVALVNIGIWHCYCTSLFARMSKSKPFGQNHNHNHDDDKIMQIMIPLMTEIFGQGNIVLCYISQL